MGVMKNFKGMSRMMKDSGLKRGEDFDYEDEGDKIIIDCKGDEKLKKRILESLDSAIEWGLRMTR